MNRVSHEIDELLETFDVQIDESVVNDDAEESKPRYTGEQIKLIRKRDDITQSQFAKMLNVSVGAVRSWEQGEKEPNGSAMRLVQIIDNIGYYDFYELFDI